MGPNCKVLPLSKMHLSVPRKMFSEVFGSECISFIGSIFQIKIVRLPVVFFIELAAVIEAVPMGVVHLGTLSAVSCHAMFL